MLDVVFEVGVLDLCNGEFVLLEGLFGSIEENDVGLIFLVDEVIVFK